MDYDEKSGSYVVKGNCGNASEVLVLDDTSSKDKKIIDILSKMEKPKRKYVNYYGMDDYDYYDEYGFWDNFDFDDEGYHKNYNKGKKDKKENTKEEKKKYNISEIDDEFFSSEKTIYFYSDINNPSKENTEKFDNINDFSDFLDENGIFITDEDINKLMLLEVVHCCINPYDKGVNNEPILLVDHTLTCLQWSCDVITESDFD